ncbi:hypothetical protein AAMO2058_000387700 [Amorphochlora amoebiformis]
MGITCGSPHDVKPNDMGGRPIYMDHNATTPIDEPVARHMEPLLRSCWGNPSSGHVYGKEASEALAKARLQIATLIGCTADEIIITSGGTESINHAIRGAALAPSNSKMEMKEGIPIKEKKKHIVISMVEHVAVTKTCAYLTKHHGFDVTLLPVNEEGSVSPSVLAKAVKDNTVVISIMLANNEVGTIQPVQELVKAAKSSNPNVIFHTDASQAVGKITVNVDELGVDLLTIAGHKLYAPKGIGALYIRKDLLDIVPFMCGAGHESGRRAGTENVLLACGLGKACELARLNMSDRFNRMAKSRDLLEILILSHFAGVESVVRVNGDVKNRLPNTLSISFRDIASHDLLKRIQDRVACSAGSACHSHEVTISKVLKAMNVPKEYAKGTLRLSTGIHTTKAEVVRTARIICDAVDDAMMEYYESKVKAA